METRSTCPYCGVGCGVLIQHDGSQITGVRGDPDHPANQGRLCSKGQTLHLTAAPAVTAQVRALQPLRRAARGEPLRPVVWAAALDEVADRITDAVERHGPDSVGFYLSGQLLTEDYHAFNKLARGLVGTNNVDTNSRLCMSSAVAGYKASFGSDAVPACYDDIDHAATVFLTGSNMAWAHPVLYRRLEAARRANPALKVVVVDPRRTETAAEADLHLQIQPGTDVVLHHAMLHLMLWEGLVDHAYIAQHTRGFEALRDRVREFSPAAAARTCGLKEADIVQAARWFAQGPTLSMWCQGLNQSRAGTDKNTTLLNLHLATGQIGRPGAGPLSLTGQPNAMGGREVGGLAPLLPGHRVVANPGHRAEVARLWGLKPGVELPARPGKAAVELFQAAADGELRVLWIACTNPAQSMPDQNLVRRALQRCEFVVLQEAFRGTATGDFADLLLPAASWGEKEGTVTNSERRISRVRAAVPPPGQARPDWRIAADVAQRLRQRLPDTGARFDWPDAEAVWLEHREATRGRDLDITGLSWATLEAAPAQWPAAQGQGSQARLFGDGRFETSDGRAVFHAPAWLPTAEVRDAHYPVALTTGRWRDQWHGQSRTGTLARLQAHAGAPVVELHPQELARRHWRSGQLLRVKSRRGETLLPVAASEAVPPAQAFVAMHGGQVNRLTTSVRCPQSGQPELKHSAVRLEAVTLPWQLEAAAWRPAHEVLALAQRLRPEAEAFDYGHLQPIGREPEGPLGLAIRLAHGTACDVEPWAQALGLRGAGVLRYDDARRGVARVIAVDGRGRLTGFLLVGDTAAAGWLRDWLLRDEPLPVPARMLLAGSAVPPVARPASGPVVCSCHGVTQAQIVERLSPTGDDATCLAALQRDLGCGTACGSCLPAVKALVRARKVAA